MHDAIAIQNEQARNLNREAEAEHTAKKESGSKDTNLLQPKAGVEGMASSTLSGNHIAMAPMASQDAIQMSPKPVMRVKEDVTGGVDIAEEEVVGDTPAAELQNVMGSRSNMAEKPIKHYQIQAKLKIGNPNDRFEQEAESVADRIMMNSMQTQENRVGMVPDGSLPQIHMKCKECEEEKVLQRQTEKHNGSSDEGFASEDLTKTLSSSVGKGQHLPDAVSKEIGSSMGANFSNVRIHTDQSAVQMNEELGAHAFAHGSDIYFNQGNYNLGTSDGKRLLTHELVHVVQQNATVKSIMRFGSEEHRQIGDTTSSGNTLVTSFGQISFGEMIALGDYFANVEEIARLAESWGQFGEDQIRYALHLVNPSQRPNPHVRQSVIDAVMNRYYRLAARNETHFSTGSSPGNSNREQYIDMHRLAIQDAFSEGMNPLIIRRWTYRAREGFAQHFLTDAFSSGHVRTPRGDITRHWRSLYPNFSNNLVTMISCYMASHINERDNVGYFMTVDGLAERIAPVIRRQAGNVLAAFSIGDLISKVLHDADNAGLDVISPRGIGGATNFRWRAVGDEHLFPAAGSTASTAQSHTQQMVQEASRLSFEEAEQAYRAGTSSDFTERSRLENPANFGALQLIPIEDPNSSTNVTYLWRASDIRSLPANIQSLIVAAFGTGTEVRHELDSMNVDCITSQSGFDLHTRDAFLCFKNHFISNIWQTIVDVAEGNLCPAGQNDPCPTLRNTCP